MANPRKVQTEIDKLMKKVKDGMEVYDSVFEKVQSAPDKLQKEKFEAELKKEIKKLQRLREQIKLLIANPEVKDKKLLETTRRDIEIKMEAFKVCERETKTKAFSKEGLLAAKNDPALRAKLKTVNWVNDAIDELQDQIDQLEYDIENDVPNTLPMRKGKKEDPREERMARNNYHILKLESILRVLEVGDLEPEDVDEIQSDIMAYVEGLKDPSYEEDEDNDVYEVFDLPEGMVQNITGGAGGDSDSDAEEVSSPKKAEDATPPQKVAPKPAAKKSEPAAPAKAVPAPAAVPAKQQTPAGSGVTITTPAASANAKSNVASPLTAASQKTPVTPVVAKTPASAGISPSTTQGKSMAAIVAGHRAAEEAAKAAPAASPQGKQQAAPAPVKFPPQQPQLQPQQPQPSSALEDTGLDDDADENNDDTFGDDAMDGVTPGAGSLADMSSMTNKMSGLGGASTAAGGAGDWAKPLPATVAGTHPMHGAPKLPPAGPQQASPNPVAQPRTAAPTAAAPVAPAPKSVAQPAPAAVPSVPPPSFVAPAASPPVAAPPATSVPPTAVMPPSAEVIQRMLTMSLRNLPHTSDCERPKAYAPPNPYNTPEFYPQTVHPAFSNAETFGKFDPDTLFFIFYYQQTTYQQFLAAKELKKNSWRFHKKFQTWFQRHDRPKLTTEEYEQGTYIYFDFENGWCQRIKADFVFKYQHLEDALT